MPYYFLTAKVEEMDAIIRFQSGGDDYVVKPFRSGGIATEDKRNGTFLRAGSYY